MRRLRLPCAHWLLAAAAWACAPGAAADPHLAQIEATLRGEPEAALKALAEVLDDLRGAERVEALLLRGTLLVRVPDIDALEITAQELDTLSLAGGRVDPIAAAGASLLRARAVARKGPLGRADRMVSEAIERLPATTPPAIRLRFVDAQARMRQSMGKLDDAVRMYQNSVALADGLGIDWRRAEQRGALAFALYQARQAERALDVSTEALVLAMQSGDLLAISNAYTTRGIVLTLASHPTEELAAMEAAREYAHRARARREEVRATANLADFYLRHSDPAKAYQLAEQALPLAREIGDSMSESVALANAGLGLIAMGRSVAGIERVRESLAIQERAGALVEMAQIQLELGEALERAGLLKQSWAALAEHRRLADEVFQRKQQSAMLELQESFDAETRQRELALLQTENRLKDAQLAGRDLQQQLSAVAIAAGVLLLAVVGVMAWRVRRSNAALQDSNVQLKVASEVDPLTGLANRRHVQAVLERTAGGHFEGALLLIDIDHFKLINDRHGHAVGDVVLVEIARRLRTVLRDPDLTVRWGGEEFLVLVHSMAPAQVEALADRLLAAIGGEAVCHGRESIEVTASIGFASFPLEPQRRTVTWARAIDLVDTAMYLAKAHGRNRAYGVRSLDADAPMGPDAEGATLEAAWRSGRADLRLLPGPLTVKTAA